jgi:hypothetical protein
VYALNLVLGSIQSKKALIAPLSSYHHQAQILVNVKHSFSFDLFGNNTLTKAKQCTMTKLE